MTKKRQALALSAILLAIFFQYSCQGVTGPSSGYKGVIVFLGFEGGFYGIISEDGNDYDPINLPRAFQREGLRVKFDGKIRTDMASTHMWGHIFEISWIVKF